MGLSLRQFIKAVRSAKTQADEKRVIQVEAANIRASFRQESTNNNKRRNNVLKLLYLYVLGEKTQFGQIECLKLLASPRFADKRLGYLGTMLLLDEKQEVLTLVTNSLQNDLHSDNPSICALALCTLGDIASPEMAQDLFRDVDELLNSSSAYIRKKAAMTVIKIIDRVPELSEVFITRSIALLHEKNNSVLAAGLSLAISVCENYPEYISEYIQCVPKLVKILKNVNSNSYIGDYDLQNSITPHSQTQILNLFSILGRGNLKVSEQIQECLTQICSLTESSRGSVNAVLYQAVLTIFQIEADSSLRVLGINILGKFLASSDYNLRYVALNTLVKVSPIEPNAIQRHRFTILDCVRDADVSIRKRAVDLAFSLINESNVRPLINELMSFLEVADPEFKLNMTTQICIAVDRFTPSRKWQIDIMIKMLTSAGNYIREQILFSILRIFATSPDYYDYIVRKCYVSLLKDQSQEALAIAASWVIGEYGEMLTVAGSYDLDELNKPINESDVVTLMDLLLKKYSDHLFVEEFALMTLVKLTARYNDQKAISTIKSLLEKFKKHPEVELQQRSVEFRELIDMTALDKAVFERMPIPDIREEMKVIGKSIMKTPSQPKKKKTHVDELIDLIGLNDNDQAAERKLNAPPVKSEGFTMPNQVDNSAITTTMNDLASLKFTSSSEETSKLKSLLDVNGFNVAILNFKNGLTKEPNVKGFKFIFRNDSQASIQDIVLEVAVPKNMSIVLQPIQSTSLSANEQTTQDAFITVIDVKKVRMRIRLSWKDSLGMLQQQQMDVSDLIVL